MNDKYDMMIISVQNRRNVHNALNGQNIQNIQDRRGV